MNSSSSTCADIALETLSRILDILEVLHIDSMEFIVKREKGRCWSFDLVNLSLPSDEKNQIP